jgi:hypothetical protein
MPYGATLQTRRQGGKEAETDRSRIRKQKGDIPFLNESHGYCHGFLKHDLHCIALTYVYHY